MCSRRLHSAYKLLLAQLVDVRSIQARLLRFLGLRLSGISKSAGQYLSLRVTH